MRLVKDAGLVLLDEPLANLDYKLREELRAEIPKIFEKPGRSLSMPPPNPKRRCCWAATPPRCGKAGSPSLADPDRLPPARQCHHRAGVFRPADEFPELSKSGDRLLFGDGQTAPATGALKRCAMASISPGSAPTIWSWQPNPSALAFSAKLHVTEITGSETFVHLDHHGERWVGLVHGVKT